MTGNLQANRLHRRWGLGWIGGSLYPCRPDQRAGVYEIGATSFRLNR